MVHKSYALLLAGIIFAILLVLPLDPHGTFEWNSTASAAVRSTDLELDHMQYEHNYTRRTEWFQSHGDSCHAWLFLPKVSPGGDKPAVVLLAHGFGGQKDMGLAKYAQQFVKAGLAAFVFDYRGFGGSEGEPRHWVSPARHVEDWIAAVSFVRSELGESVDIRRLALWGTSFAGGHVLVTAAKLQGKISAVVAQMPFLDGWETSKRSLKRRGALGVLRLGLAAIQDLLRGWAGLAPRYVKLVGVAGQAFMLLQPDELKHYFEKHPSTYLGGWQNACTARTALELRAYSPATHLPRISQPTLLIAAKWDQLCPEAEVQAAADRLNGLAELLVLDCDHFGMYLDHNFKGAVIKQIKFLQTHLIL